MNFSLKSTIFPSVSIEAQNTSPDITKDLKLTHINVTYDVNPENKKQFANIFTIKLSNDNYKFEITAVASFDCDEDINTDNQDHLNFININTPAIAFPFVRTFIANTMLNSGYIPVILQSINFVELNRSSKTQS